MTALNILLLACYCFGAVCAVAALASKRPALSRGANALALAGLALHTVHLTAGVVHEGHLPLFGTQEVTSFLGWGLVLYYFVVQLKYPTSALASLLFPTAALLASVSALAPTIGETPETLADAPLLFSIHAGLLLLAYAAFLTMFMAGVLYIVQERELKGKRFGAAFFRLPSLDTCDTIGSRSLAVGFVLLTLGIGAGITWSKLRDGIFWHGDPTEVFAVGTWVVYLVLMHYRLAAGWRGRRAALVSIVGFGLVLFSLFVVKTAGGFHGL